MTVFELIAGSLEWTLSVGLRAEGAALEERADAAAEIDRIYREHAETVFRYLLVQMTDEERRDAEDLTQETFLRAISAVKSYDGSCKITTWLCAIAKRVLSEYRKRNNKYPAAEKSVESVSVESVESSVVSEMSRRDLYRRIHALGGETAEVMLLRLTGDLSFREIADILDITENKARVVFYRGKEKLRKELEADGQ